MPKDSVFTDRLNDAILRLQQSGLMLKLFNELQWDVEKQRGRSSSALLKAATSKQFKIADADERGLTLADTEGMFLLMGIGYLIGGSVLMSEVIGGCANKCRKITRRVSVSGNSANEQDSSVIANTSRSSIIDTMQFRPLESDNSVSSSLLRQRRKSDQTEISRTDPLKSILNGHRRHNSLVSDLRYPLGTFADGRKKSFNVTFTEGLPVARDSSLLSSGKCYHTVEINRIPTPFSIEETFGEKIYH